MIAFEMLYFFIVFMEVLLVCLPWTLLSVLYLRYIVWQYHLSDNFPFGLSWGAVTSYKLLQTTYAFAGIITIFIWAMSQLQGVRIYLFA